MNNRPNQQPKENSQQKARGKILREQQTLSKIAWETKNPDKRMEQMLLAAQIPGKKKPRRKTPG